MNTEEIEACSEKAKESVAYRPKACKSKCVKCQKNCSQLIAPVTFDFGIGDAPNQKGELVK